MAKTYTYAIFDSKQRAYDAIEALEDEFQARDIDVLLQDPGRNGETREIAWQMRTSVGTGIAVGASFGAIALAVVALATAVFAADPWVAALNGILIGSFVGGLVGAVGGLATWRRKPNLPDSISDETTIMVGVATEEARVATAQKTLARAGAQQISVLEAGPRLATA